MKTKSHHIPRTQLWISISLALAGSSNAQSTASPPAVPEDVIELSVFEVDATKDSRYAATNTLAATRVRTNVSDVASSITVFTGELLDDLNVNDASALFLYAPSTEVGGIYGNFAGAGSGSLLDENAGFRSTSTTTRVRGLAEADNTRNYFATIIPWDGYNIGRVDMQRGPNSVLYGLGKPAGIVNTTLNDATFRDLFEASLQVASFGTTRGTLDVNRVVLKDELAVRVNALREDIQYRQEPAFETDRRLYIATRYQPRWLNSDAVKTTLMANYEKGRIKANRPRSLPPIDLITPWFTAMGRQGFDPYAKLVDSPAPGFGQAVSGNPNFSPWLGNMAEVYGTVAFFFDSPGLSAASRAMQGEINGARGLGPNGAVDGTVTGVPAHRLSGVAPYPTYASTVGLPFASFGQYKNRNLTDPTIFDFYNLLLDGNNKWANSDFSALNLRLTQTYLRDRLGWEFAYDRQEVNDEQLSLLSDFRQAIHIDINSRLTDGSTNPNFGRPFTSDQASYGNSENSILNDTYRLTTFGSLDFRAANASWWRRLLGRHNFTGLFTRADSKGFGKGFVRYAMSPEFGSAVGVTDLNSSVRGVSPVVYLGPSLAGRTSASGAGIGNIVGRPVPQTGNVTFWDATWVGTVDPAAPWQGSTQSENPANYRGWTTRSFGVLNALSGDRDALTNRYTPFETSVDSLAMVWQGYLWNDALIPLVGLRKDVQKKRTGNAPRLASGAVDLRVTADDFNEKEVDGGWLRTTGGVLHVNQLLRRDRLPIDVRLRYGRSENFDPAADRVDMLGNALPSPSGRTEDYGISLSTKDGRYSISVTRFETEVKNATNDVMTNNIWGVGFIENWAYARAMVFRLNRGSPDVVDYLPIDGQTAAEAAALEERQVGAYLANLPPPEFFRLWSIDTNPESLNQQGQTYTWTAVTPSGLTATNDTLSKGYEIELAANPIANLDIVFNASKIDAFRSNVGGATGDFIAERYRIMRETPAGDMRFWWAGDTSTYLSNAGWAYLGAYELLRLGEGLPVPELRKWRFNLVANYRFTEGRLRGWNAGASYRWEDRIVLGYDAVQGAGGTTAFDFANPYLGPEEDALDFWFGYERKVGRNMKWRAQLNVRDVFASKGLIPVTVNPGGAPAGFRIAPERTWAFTNTLSF